MNRNPCLHTLLVAVIAGSASLMGGCGEQGPICNTPLVLSFDGSPVEYVAGPGENYFELGQHSLRWTTDWPTAKTPWLARDLNANGAINEGKELFGSEALLHDGSKAEDGFQALADLDTDGNGRIDESDAAWNSLLVWQDDDADRRSNESELRTLEAAGILWIDLPGALRSSARGAGVEVSNPPGPRCDSNGNCEVERSVFGYSNGTEKRKGAVIDIHLRAFQKDKPENGYSSSTTGGSYDGLPPGCK